MPRQPSATRVAMMFVATHKIVAASALDGMTKKQAKDWVNRLMDPHTRGIFQDQYWRPINAIWKNLETKNIPFAITHSEYEYDGDRSNGPIRKVWMFEIDFHNERGQTETLYGRITAAGAGPVEEPLKIYDVVAYVS